MLIRAAFSEQTRSKGELAEHLLCDTGQSRTPTPRTADSDGVKGGWERGPAGVTRRRDRSFRRAETGRMLAWDPGEKGRGTAAITDVPVTLQPLQRRPLFAEAVLGGRGRGPGGSRR